MLLTLRRLGPPQGENALLSVLTVEEKLTLAALLRKLVEAAEAGPAASEPKRSRSDGT